VSRQAVDKRRRSGKLIGVRSGRREWGYPAWQFTQGGSILPGLESILWIRRDDDPIMQMLFFLNGNSFLDGRSPLSLLRAGQVGEVAQVAEVFGEHAGP
jgi:hypothetical protein